MSWEDERIILPKQKGLLEIILKIKRKSTYIHTHIIYIYSIINYQYFLVLTIRVYLYMPVVRLNIIFNMVIRIVKINNI